MVTDINDNAPVLSQDVYVATVPENVGISHTLLDIDATDYDKEVSSDLVSIQIIPFTFYLYSHLIMIYCID